MTDITVTILGMILFVSARAYDPGGSPNLSAAVAANASKPIESHYDVDLPTHVSALQVADSDVLKNIGDLTRISVGSNGSRQITLRGDHVFFGKMSGSSCKPLVAAVESSSGKSFLEVPRLDQIISDKLRLKKGSFPDSAGTDFTAIDSNIVSAWFDIPQGMLRVLHSDDRTDDAVQFRPSRKIASLPSSVKWHLIADADCVAVVPFQRGTSAGFVFKPAIAVHVTFENVAEDASTGEAFPGIGYDYEVLYSLLDGMPAVPPIPYSIKPPTADDHVRGMTGVDCAPAGLLPGGGGGGI